MNFDAAKQFVLDKLNGELSNNLVYHSVEHTLDVVKAARVFGEMEGLQNREIRLVETAALFHDVGFIKAYDDHETHSIQIAREALPDFGYSEEEIEIIVNLIKVTEVPQKPKNHLQEILADADLNYLGRDDMFVIGQRLHYEWCLHGKLMTLREWHETQIDFLRKHHYFTQSAIKLREPRKQENIRELENLLGMKK